MQQLQKYSHLVLLVLLTVFVASCNKRDENLATDYESKKASADKLITEVNEGLTRMEPEHADMMKDLDSAGLASKDSAKVNSIKEEMNRHMEQAAKVKALVDSVKAAMTLTTDNDDQLRAANDALGTHFDDLTSEWKALQDQHAKMQQDIQSFAVNAAGDAVVDSARLASGGTTTTTTGGGAAVKPKSGTTTTTKTTTTKTTTTPKPNSQGEVRHQTPKKSTGGDPIRTGGSNTNTGTGTQEKRNETPKQSTGGDAPRSGGTTQKK